MSASSSSYPWITSSCCCRDWHTEHNAWMKYQTRLFNGYVSGLSVRAAFVSRLREICLFSTSYTCTNLGDFVVVCQKHGQVLRLLNGWRFRHLSEELSSSGPRQETRIIRIWRSELNTHETNCQSKAEVCVWRSLTGGLRASGTEGDKSGHEVQLHADTTCTLFRYFLFLLNPPFMQRSNAGNSLSLTLLTDAATSCLLLYNNRGTVNGNCPSFWIPFVGRVVVLDAAFHVLQLIQHSEHVDELSEGKQVRLRDKVLPALSVTETTDFPTETVNSCALGERKRRGRVRLIWLAGQGECQLLNNYTFTWKYMKFISLVTSGSRTSTVFS